MRPSSTGTSAATKVARLHVPDSVGAKVPTFVGGEMRRPRGSGRRTVAPRGAVGSAVVTPVAPRSTPALRRPRVRSARAGGAGLAVALAALVAILSAACDDGSGKRPAPGPSGPAPAAGAAPGDRPSDALNPSSVAPTAARNAPAPGPAPGQADAPTDPPADAVVDDDEVLAAVVESATNAAALPARYATLPPRVSPVRVAVRALHDHLVAAPGSIADWDALLAALGRLAEGDRTTVDAGALAPLLAAWRGWTLQHRDAEARLAVRYVRGLDLLAAQGKFEDGAAAALLRDLPAAPPKSPARACVSAVDAVRAMLATPGGDADAQLMASLDAADAAFRDLGWPGGIGRFLEIGAARIERDSPATLRSHVLRDRAQVAYQASGDALGAALVTFERVASAHRAGDIDRAAKLAALAAEQIRAAGVRGRELTDALCRRAQLELPRGRAAEALSALDATLVEIDYAKLDPAQRVVVQQLRATSLWMLRRHDEAVAAADDGIRTYDASPGNKEPVHELVRAELDEIAARALVDSGRPADAVARLLAAADRRAKLPGGDASAAVDRLAAADAWVRAGRPDEARKLVASVLAAAGIPHEVRAQAAAVLRELGDFDGAERELARVEQGGDRFRDALTEERARLAAARGDLVTARALFAVSVRLAMKDPAGAPPQRTAATLIDWARVEERAGDFPEAARLADQAIGLVLAMPLAPELDRARVIWVRVARRLDLGAFAEGTALDRMQALATDPVARREAASDVALVRLELAARGDPKSRAALGDVADAGHDRVVHELIRALVPEYGLAPVVRSGEPAAARPATPRFDRLEAAARLAGGAADALIAFARSLPADEPELRRWALRRAAARPASELRAVDWAAFLDVWSGAAPTTSDALAKALRAGERFIGIASLGGRAVIVDGEPGRVTGTVAPDDAAIVRFFDGLRDGPTPERLRDDGRAFVGFDDALRAALGERPDERLVIAVAPPVGPLPCDLLVRRTHDGDRTLIEEREVGIVASPAEFVAAVARPAPPSPAFLRSPAAPLDARHAVVSLVPVDDTTRARFVALFEDARRRGLATSAAVRDAKLRMRAEWKPDPARPDVPPWAWFALRGAP